MIKFPIFILLILIFYNYNVIKEMGLLINHLFYIQVPFWPQGVLLIYMTSCEREPIWGWKCLRPERLVKRTKLLFLFKLLVEDGPGFHLHMKTQVWVVPQSSIRELVFVCVPLSCPMSDLVIATLNKKPGPGKHITHHTHTHTKPWHIGKWLKTTDKRNC